MKTLTNRLPNTRTHFRSLIGAACSVFITACASTSLTGGESLLATDDTHRAETPADEVPDDHKSSKEDALTLARSLRDSGYFEAAAQVYAKAELDGRLNARESLEYATVAAEARPPSTALALFETAVQRLGGLERMSSTERYAACQGLGRATLALQRPGSAVQHFQCALQVQPASLSSLNGLAVAHSLSGDSRAAIDLFQQILVIDPDNPAALNNLALQYLTDQQSERAIHLLQSNAQPTATQVLNLALALVLDQQTERADGLLRDHFYPEQAVLVIQHLKQVDREISRGKDLRQLLVTLSQKVYQLSRVNG